jgi:hypothetical protein
MSYMTACFKETIQCCTIGNLRAQPACLHAHPSCSTAPPHVPARAFYSASILPQRSEDCRRCHALLHPCTPPPMVSVNSPTICPRFSLCICSDAPAHALSSASIAPQRPADCRRCHALLHPCTPPPIVSVTRPTFLPMLLTLHPF